MSAWYTGDGARHYRRGAVMGLTVAEVFLLLAFVLLMLLMLWRSEAEDALSAVQDYVDMPVEARENLAGVSRALESAGVSVQDPAVAQGMLRFIQIAASPNGVEVIEQIANQSDPSLRDKLAIFFELQETEAGRGLMDALAAAPEGERRRLVELVASKGVGEAVGSLERIGSWVDAAGAAPARLADALERELGSAVRSAGGEIAPDGSLVFPDTVLFEPGSAEITPTLREFLGSICLPWFRTLESVSESASAPSEVSANVSGAIAELRIEGHASSEWDAGGATPPETAYLLNLALSQARAHAVLSTCLALAPGPEGAWARARATAIGYSSSHPVLTEGHEDRVKSRRVVFGASFNQDAILEAIGGEVDGTAGGGQPAISPAGAAADTAVSMAVQSNNSILLENSEQISGSDASLSGNFDAKTANKSSIIIGVASVIDGDTLEISGKRIRLHGIDAPEAQQLCEDLNGADYRCGQSAALALADRIGRAPVVCEPRGSDRYGRTLAVCQRDGLDLNRWMVAEGYALAYRQYAMDYVEDEVSAAAARRGIWQGSFVEPWSYRK